MKKNSDGVCNGPVSRVVDMETGTLVTVYKNLDGTVIGWNRRKQRMENL